MEIGADSDFEARPGESVTGWKVATVEARATTSEIIPLPAVCADEPPLPGPHVTRPGAALCSHRGKSRP